MNKHLSAFLSARLIDRKDAHRRKVLALLAENAAFDRRGDDERNARQAERLADLLDHAREHVPHFGALLGERSEIDARNARAVLEALPVMRRSDIQRDPDAFLADDHGGAACDATGGSTGTPLSFRVDRETQRAREASLMWGDSLAGWEYGERIAMLWGSARDVQSATGRLRSWLRWRIENRRWYDAFEMDEERMFRFHRDMSRFRPHLLVAYAGTLHVFARFLESKSLRPDYPAKAIVSSAEVITPSMRSDVARVFGAPVFDRYGNREFGAIAAECGVHAGLHVNETDCIVEIDSPDPFREPGPVLVTYLNNFAMPFIRYDTGDLAHFESAEICACGCRTLRMAPVTGRRSDTIRTASGKLIHGEFFTHLLYGATGIREFQFVQERIDRYVLNVAGDREQIRSQEAAWRARILDAVGQGAELVINRVDDIPVLPSGKRKFTVSLLDDQPR